MNTGISLPLAVIDIINQRSLGISLNPLVCRNRSNIEQDSLADGVQADQQSPGVGAHV